MCVHTYIHTYLSFYGFSNTVILTQIAFDDTVIYCTARYSLTPFLSLQQLKLWYEPIGERKYCIFSTVFRPVFRVISLHFLSFGSSICDFILRRFSISFYFNDHIILSSYYLTNLFEIINKRFPSLVIDLRATIANISFRFPTNNSLTYII